MKRFIAVTMATIMLAGNAFAADISVTLDGENVEFSTQSPVIVEGRTLVPLRGVFEKLGYGIGWDNETKTATFVKDMTVVKVTANASEFTVGTDVFKLDVPAQIINGSMMLPLRAIGEATGLEVEWDNDTKTVSFAIKKTEQTTEQTTEKSVSTDNKEKVYQDIAQNFIDIVLVMSLANYYSNSLYYYLADDEKNDVSNIDFERSIQYADYVLSKVDTLNKNEYNKEIIDEVVDLANASKKLFTRAKAIADADRVGVDYADDEIEAVFKEVDDVEDAIDKCDEAFLEYQMLYDVDEDELSDVQNKIARAYNKEVGSIIDKALSVDLENCDRKQQAENLRKAAKEIKENVSKLTTYDYILSNHYAILEGCDILMEAADLYENIEDDDFEELYFKALILTFEICAKNSAGDYYVYKALTHYYQ